MSERRYIALLLHLGEHTDSVTGAQHDAERSCIDVECDGVFVAHIELGAISGSSYLAPTPEGEDLGLRHMWGSLDVLIAELAARVRGG